MVKADKKSNHRLEENIFGTRYSPEAIRDKGPLASEGGSVTAGNE